MSWLVASCAMAAPPVMEYPAEEITPYTAFRKPPQPARMIQEGFLWLEAEDFQSYGDWRLDTQFVQQMGSAYLLAAGVGRPIADARSQVEITKAGTYRLWVRTKNWLKEHSPGKFTVAIGDTRSQKVLGAVDSGDWIWELAGDFNLKAGSTSITLKDLSGYFARCDALLLTSDLTYAPPTELNKLQAERARLSGVPLQPKSEGDFEVVVVGGGAAGSCAAIAAARMGAKTVLLQDRPVLGGNASDELGVGICGASVALPNARESGIIEEASRIRAHNRNPRMTEAFRTLAETEPNLTILYNRRVVGVEMVTPDTIALTKAVNTLDGSLSTVSGRYFIDSTGDGWLGFFAGAKFRLGREAREEFGEDLAPAKADNITMSGCLMGNYAISFRARPVGNDAPYTPPAWIPKLPAADEFGRRIRSVTSGEWWIEHPGEIDDLWNPELARDELVRISFAYWDFLKNHWEGREQARKHVLTFVPFMNAKRETRRLMGDYLLRQQDVQSATMFPDRIAHGGWPIDVHHPKGIFSGKEGPFDYDPHVPLYSIPFRCLYSTNIANLFFAGRNVSVTHVALGTVRVQGTLATLGQAAGTAAALCLQKGVNPRLLGQKYTELLQQTLLKNDQFIPELKNEDPLDLARKATVTASSICLGDTFDKDRVATHESHELTTTRAIKFPRGVHRELRNVFVLLRSKRTSATEMVLSVRGSKAPGDFTATNTLAIAKATLPPGKQAWLKFAVNCNVDDPWVWFSLPATKGVEWVMMTHAPLESGRAYGGGVNKPWAFVRSQFYAAYTEPPITIGADYKPEHVLSGVSRIAGKTMNQWASDPSQAMPQWLELDFGKAAKLNSVHLTFDTDMNERSATNPKPPRCVQNYTVMVQDGSGWREVAAVKDNFQRQRIHRFPATTTQKVRILVQNTNGDKSARIFEVRAYGE
jgi:hypothetical protein